MTHHTKQMTDKTSHCGLIWMWLDHISLAFYHLVKNSFFAKWISSYAVQEETFEKRTLLHRNVTLNVADEQKKKRRTFVKKCEESFTSHTFERVSECLMGAPLNIYGMYFLLFGAFSLICYYLHTMLSDVTDSKYLVWGICCFIVSMPMITVGRPLYRMLQESRFASFFLDMWLGFRVDKYTPYSSPKLFWWPISLAVMCGVLAFWMGPFVALLLVPCIVTLCLFIIYPEFAVILTATVAPWMLFANISVYIITIPMMIAIVGYSIKLLQGRRTFRWQLMDAMVMALGIVYFVSGLLSKDFVVSVRRSLVYVIMLFAYFLTVNLMRTQDRSKRVKTVLTISGIFASVYGIIVKITGHALEEESGWISSSAFLLIVLLLLVIDDWKNETSRTNRFLCSLALIPIVLCLFMYSSYRICIPLCTALLLYGLLNNYKVLHFVLVCILPSSAIGCWIIPSIKNITFGASWQSAFGLNENAVGQNVRYFRLNVWPQVLKMIKDNYFAGYGFSRLQFAEMFTYYTDSNVTSFDAHNMYLQTIWETGIVGLIVFLFMILVLLRFCFGYLQTFKDNRYSGEIVVCIATVFVILMLGCMDSIFGNPVNFFLFWLFVGYIVSLARNEVGERTLMMVENKESVYSSDAIFVSEFNQ